MEIMQDWQEQILEKEGFNKPDVKPTFK